MKITKQIDVRLQKEYITPRVDCVQFDQGLELVLNIKDFEIPSGSSAKFYVEKPSGKFVYQNCTVSSTNKITIAVENQALAEYGTVYGQVRITNSGTVSTFDIVLSVKKSRADAQAVESKNMISAFDEKAAELLANLGIDTTLTKSGLAADAKVVGDTISKTKQDMDSSIADIKELLRQVRDVLQNGNISDAVDLLNTI